ncbi:putative addiction module antidote protein [Rhodovulum sulfidophilum]|uniref:addiction module antidote protein n=1 Tax=Rhodovulum sulfidophilum TaxID=35806 RepID=UPI001921BDF1|nr:addiction module antidote protein [Rhodovulum sulfidophilum]MBL3576354.1 putative addiction module antidote protein [Rhodovulum sulfidophilum]MCE8433749.1 putative addiction module antidote protein [Rhodovulum sulfidophilum]MCF4119193.1 putative addiction module antidote protein [Rhodovulum sulfidophilum]
MPIETTRFDAAEYLDTPEAQAMLLSDAFETGDAAYIKHAIGIVARARGIKDTAEAAGITREALHRALGEKGNPRLSTVLGVTKALGLTLKVEASA